MEDSPDNQSNSMSDLKKSTGRLADGTDSCTTTSMSSSNCSGAKTLIVYENDESIEIKEEIIEERHHGGEHNLLSEKSQLDEKSISSGKTSAPKTSIVYECDETLKIKEEIIQEPQAVASQKRNEKCLSTCNTVDTIEASSLAVKKRRTHKKNKIDESKLEPLKKYNCRKCPRSYKYKRGLDTHHRFECGITPQFICEFCDKRFKRKGHMRRHVSQVHQKTISNQNKEKIQKSKRAPEKKHNIRRHRKTNPNTSKSSYNCDKCFRSYSSLDYLKQHQRLKHAAVIPQFVCDICSYNTNLKSNLSNHISSRHFKNSKVSQARYNCDKCCLSYSSLATLKQHERLKHAVVKPQFVCHVCNYKANRKCSLANHISLRHFKNSGTSQARHTCDKCFQSYSSLSGLYKHNLAKHAVIKPEFICDICDYKTNQKSNLEKHISSRHFKSSKKSEAIYNCDKCFQNYSSFSGLYRHNLVKHALVKPEFTCDLCSFKTHTKYILSNHISSRHFKNSKTSQESYNCDKCFLSYSSLRGLQQHMRLKHPSVKRQLICDICGYETNIRSHLSRHISSLHLKIIKTSQAKYNCDKCSQSYSSWTGLYYHNVAKHAVVTRKFICHVCSYKASRKYHLLKHISSRHVK